MKVSDAVLARRSIRAFTSKTVPKATLRQAIEQASRSPSGGNLQPWRIYAVAGDTLKQIKDSVHSRIERGEMSDSHDYAIYPSNLWEPYRTERYVLGEDMYRLLGIDREDKLGRVRQFAQNFEMFSAPQGLFCYVDRRMGPPQWADLGMYLQTLMLLLQDAGIDTCAQEAWSTFSATVAKVLSPPPELMLFCGMAIGYRVLDARVNQLVSRRLPLDSFADFRGF